MKLETIKLDKAINKAYFKQSLKRADIELFKTNFKRLFERINETESEEHNKNIVSDFLKNTFYKDRYEINTSGRKDLAIHKGNTSQTPVSVIIEAKRPSTRGFSPLPEMISFDKPNAKALHEIIHYYLHERLINRNNEIKHLIITNIYDWFIFDATEFEKYFYANKNFRNKYQEWIDKELVGTKTDWFYTEIAKPFIDNELDNLQCVYLNLQGFKNLESLEDGKLINLYKILSPEHLLKLPFANDYNKIDNGFYNELLHILGLEETNKSGKKLITRIKQKERKAGSLLENAINEITLKHRLKHVERLDLYGETEEEQLFSVGLELVITWLNRILFLKLLEAQLIKYHKGNKDYEFINIKKIKDFNELDELFFEVLAKQPKKRSETVNQKFGNLPYLNSSLFEISKLEDDVLFIGNLKDRLTLETSKQTVLKDKQGNKFTGELNTLEYLFDFLNSYSFASDDKAEIQNDNRTIINAAVLGLIFEKINGYKDGSFYTPSFITSFISRETIRNTVVDKFRNSNLSGFENLTDFEVLKDRVDYHDAEQRKTANEIINSMKICDPAVGSGHFLVSALNELIAVKSELKILSDPEGIRIRGIKIDNVNDELEIIDEETSEPFQYIVNEKGNPPSEIQNIQKAIFNEKRKLIENCIYGVDINPKSVLICRLRLWIELLKNTFYTEETNFKYLETLPNIDINIKTGNSLISKFDTGLNIFEQKAVNNLIIQYKLVTDQYKRTSDYDQKEKFRDQINRLKTELEKYAIPKDKHYRKYLKKKNELGKLLNVNSTSKEIIKQITNLNEDVAKLKNKYKENYYNVYANSMEWSVEFPEILSDEGKFQGFDVVIGNPPYISSKEIKNKKGFDDYISYTKQFDLFSLFIERALQITKPNGINSLIIPDSFLGRDTFSSIREHLYRNANLYQIIQLDNVFDKANVSNCIYFLKNSKQKSEKIEFWKINGQNIDKKTAKIKYVSFLTDKLLNSYRIIFTEQKELDIIKKIFSHIPVSKLSVSWRGEEIGKKSELIQSKHSKNSLQILTGENIRQYNIKGKKYFIEEKKIKKNLAKYQQEKIVIRQLGDYINATISKHITIQSVYCLISTTPSYSHQLILGIINSNFVNFVYKNYIAEKQSFPRILLHNLRKLTIPEITEDNQKNVKKIEKLVTKIIKLKETDTEADISAQQTEIDKLVYQLYDLTDEEIEMIENGR